MLRKNTNAAAERISPDLHCRQQFICVHCVLYGWPLGGWPLSRLTKY